MSAPRRQPAQRQRGRTGEVRREAVAALPERAAAQVRELITGEDWEAWLRLAARFPGWSFSNVMLIAAQRPTASVLAGYQAWQAQGRQVRRGEPGIRLIAESPASADQPRTSSPPARADVPDRTVDSGRGAELSYMWDIAQTSGPVSAESANPAPAAEGMPPGLWDALTWLARREGFAVDRGDSGPGPGTSNWSSRRIRIRSGLNHIQAAAALVHELGHVLAHDGLALLPGPSTAGCRGIQKIEADSIAFIVAVRLGMDTADCSWPTVASWAGSDPRARPQETICSTGSRITAAAATIAGHLDAVIDAARPQHTAASPVHSPDPPELAAGTGIAGERTATTGIPAATAGLYGEIADTAAVGPPAADIGRVLLDAERFYLGHLAGSWVPAYLQSRGFSHATWTSWRIGYAPAGWTALMRHLRAQGHDEDAIEAAGLARRSSRGTLIDHFRDRVMLAIRDEHGMIAGFIGRAHPHAGPTVPKYLNSPETPAFTKGDLLFGLHEARGRLARGAVPVIAEGPFDAIAISMASPGRHAGLAPCGTALTSRQAAALDRVADLPRTGVLVALDGDRAGRAAAVRAHTILLPFTGMAGAVLVPAGRDPAEILQSDGPAALGSLLQHHVEPLARVVIDAHIDSWADRLDDAEGQLRAMRSAAALIASLLAPETADRILQITGGRTIATLDESLHPVANTELPPIARILPASATCQIARVADRLGSEYSEVTAEVVNAISSSTAAPERAASRGTRNNQGDSRTARADAIPARLSIGDFPGLSQQAGNTAAGPGARPRMPPVQYRNRPRGFSRR